MLAGACALLLAAIAPACRRDEPPTPAAERDPEVASRVPVIDVHTHFPPRAATRAVGIMDAYGIEAVVNLSGGVPGGGLEDQLAAAAAHPGRIVVFTNLDFGHAAAGPGYGDKMAADLARARELGARGLKISKGLGLGFRDRQGQVIPVDAPELDPVFERAGELGMPVAIHTGDPVAFWEAPTPDNERHAELRVHPGWSLHGRDVPSWEELIDALERRIARHPRTTFVSVHFGNAPERPERVRAMLEVHDNLYIDTAARVPEIGRHDPAEMRALFSDFRDRILFGTDLGVGVDPRQLMLGSTGERPPSRADVDHFFTSTWRYFETGDRDFAHPTPIQGDWPISGVELPAEVLAAVYRENARRLLGLEPP